MHAVETAGETLRQVMRHVPSPVTVVTMATDEGPRGVTIGSFTSVSLAPPLISFNVQQDSQAYDALHQAERFAVHILSASQAALSTHFALPDKTSEEQFAPVDYQLSEYGVPLLQGSVATLHCVPYAIHQAGDHDLVLGEVVQPILGTSRAPLLYHDRTYREVGPEVTSIRF